MLKHILRFKTALMFSVGLSMVTPGAFAQGHQEGHNGGHNRSTMNRGSMAHGRNNGQRGGHGNRHYYHNGNWNRNGWYGWGTPFPVMSDGVLVASLPPGSTTVLVGGNTYYYGNDMYFRQVPAGGFAVVNVSLTN